MLYNINEIFLLNYDASIETHVYKVICHVFPLYKIVQVHVGIQSIEVDILLHPELIFLLLGVYLSVYEFDCVLFIIC